MPEQHNQELREFAHEAAKLAEQIHQDWGSAVGPGGFQVRVNRDMPKHGPDPDLQKIEHLLGGVIKAIDDYLRRAG